MNVPLWCQPKLDSGYYSFHQSQLYVAPRYPTILLYSSISKIKRKKKTERKKPPNDDVASQERRRYLCTGYDMYCCYEPSVFEAMSCLHSRLRRLVYCSQSQAVAANSARSVLQHGCSKYHIHDLPETNHRFRVFQYHSKEMN